MNKTKKTLRTPWRFQNNETVAQAMKRCDINAHQLHLLVPCSVQSAYNWVSGKKPIDPYQGPLAKALKIPKCVAVK